MADNTRIYRVKMKFNQFANTIKPKQMHTLNKEFILIFQNLIIHSLSVYYSHRDLMHSQAVFFHRWSEKTTKPSLEGKRQQFNYFCALKILITIWAMFLMLHHVHV